MSPEGTREAQNNDRAYLRFKIVDNKNIYIHVKFSVIIERMFSSISSRHFFRIIIIKLFIDTWIQDNSSTIF